MARVHPPPEILPHTKPPPPESLPPHAEPAPLVWPPRLSDDQIEVLVSNIKDWQITNGSMLKVVRTESETTVFSYPVGVTLFPTLFPQHLFSHAVSLQAIYNKLYAAVADDEEWLHDTLKDLIAVEPLAAALWSVHEKLKEQPSVQQYTLGIFRSDYMLHATPNEDPVLKQVEFNTISCAGGIHSDRISDMHRHLHRIGAYQQNTLAPEFKIVQKKTVETISGGLKEAISCYTPTFHEVCVLMVVQPNNFNIADERPIEYALWDMGVPTFRIEWGPDIFEHTCQTETRELIYYPPTRDGPMEVAVIYYRAGFEAREYETDIGIDIRLHLESSKAIKCPSLLSHLTTFKKIQQALALPGALERYLDPSEAAMVSETFAPMYPLDESEDGRQGKLLALNLAAARNHVLKPSLEGGGHNIYGEDIPRFLEEEVLPEYWHAYILQEKIMPPVVRNYLMSPDGLYGGSIISELGVFGACIWIQNNGKRSSRRAVVVKNLESSCSFKTKRASVDEMSVVKGFGVFDSPLLVDMETFLLLKEDPDSQLESVD